MSEDIFEEAGNDKKPAIDETLTADQLVGEDKKYKNVDDLAKAKVHADAFIDQLKGELQGIREDLSTRVKLEEVLDKLTSQNAEKNDDDEDDPYRDDTPTSGQPAINKQEIEQLVENLITNKERDRTASQNKQLAKNKLKELLGDNYLSHLESRREELGLSKDKLNDLAAVSPNAFIELVAPGRKKEETPFSPPKNQMNTGSLSFETKSPGSSGFYRELKKKDPKAYWSPKVQNQLHKDAMKAANEGREFEI